MDCFSHLQSSLIALVEPKEDFSDLAPNQRRKKLQQRLDEINTRLLQETATRDGLMKMKGVYEQNRALGDPLSIEGQLSESGQRYIYPLILFANSSHWQSQFFAIKSIWQIKVGYVTTGAELPEKPKWSCNETAFLLQRT